MKRSQTLVLALLLLFVARPADSARAGTSVPPPEIGPDTPWIWVVPRVVLRSGEDWVVSALYTGLGSLGLQLQLVDREGGIAAEASWELVAGRPADYRLAGLAEAPLQTPLSLVVSGLGAGPNWLSLSMWRSAPAGVSEEVVGGWIRSDPSWLPGVRSGP